MRNAVTVFEGAEELEFAGPWEVLAAWHFLYPVAATLATLASGAGDSYGRAIGEILRSFEMCDRFLENLPVANTVIALQALAERRNMTMDLKSPFLPANGYGDGRRAPGAMAS